MPIMKGVKGDEVIYPIVVLMTLLAFSDRQAGLRKTMYLSSKPEGVDVEIELTWFGERRPAAANDAEAGRELNRRF